MPASGSSELIVSLELRPGWVVLPRPGEPPKGLLRRNPYEVVARDLVASGAVIRPLLRLTAEYLERVAGGDAGALAVAALVRAPSRDEHTFATFAVLPGPPLGGTPLEELAARRGSPGDSEHEVTAAVLPWGRGARAAYTRVQPGAQRGRPVVQYWMAPDGLTDAVIVLGDVDAPRGAPVEDHISDIDELARTLTISHR